MAAWRRSVTQTVGVERVADISGYVVVEAPSGRSPIDDFYQETRQFLTAATPAELDSGGWRGALYALGIVSTTENYFRNVLSRILKLCSDTQKNAANHNINFGSVIWHPQDLIERGAYEHVSFAGSKDIVEISRKYVGLDLNKQGLAAALEEFDCICELRHAIVHSGRVLAGKNAIKLKLPASANVTRVEIRYAQLQEMSAICTSLVVAFNQLMFEEMCRRWATTWRRSPSWCQDAENNLFKRIWFTFHSSIDSANGTIPTSGTWVKCRNAVKAEYNV
jgi:hypothetical protein